MKIIFWKMIISLIFTQNVRLFRTLIKKPAIRYSISLYSEKRKVSKPQNWKLKKLKEQNQLTITNDFERDHINISEYDGNDIYDGMVIERQGDKLLIELKTVIPSASQLIENENVLTNNTKNEIENYVLCSQKASLTDIKVAVGDYVHWKYISKENKQGLVLTIKSRLNSLCRPSTGSNGNKLELKTIASNIDQIILVVAAIPQVPLSTLDKFIIAAHAYDIPNIFIVVNKWDLPDSIEYEKELNQYENLGYKILRTSTNTGYGLDDLTAMLSNKTSIFVGQSGVGKSSLLNAILPSVNIKVGDLVKNTNIGSHTTSNARLYHLPNGGNIIDSPGIRELGVWHLTTDMIQNGFIEITPLTKQCKFRNCKHSSAEGDTCAIRRAVMEGTVTVPRFLSYKELMNLPD